MEKLGIIGQGFVGSAVREGLKNYYDLILYDKDPSKRNVNSLYDLMEQVDMTFLCVPTPMKKSGECDLSILRMVLQEINGMAAALKKEDFIVIIKSTIPPGSTDQFNKDYPYIRIAFNPEFLTEANAMEDFKNQNRIVIGCDRPYSSRVKQIFSKAFPNVPVIKTSPAIAETIKYVTNTFLSLKVSYANEIYKLCQALNIDYDKVIEYAKYDTRLGNSHWSVPGPDGDFGYGGHCFPKDIAALKYVANQLGVDTTMLDATINKNNSVRTDLDWTKQVGRAVSEE